MVTAKTAKDTTVYLNFIEDVDPNKDGFYVEIYLHPAEDRYDDFCIHPEDVDCRNPRKVQQYAIQYVKTIKEY